MPSGGLDIASASSATGNWKNALKRPSTRSSRSGRISQSMSSEGAKSTFSAKSGRPRKSALVSGSEMESTTSERFRNGPGLTKKSRRVSESDIRDPTALRRRVTQQLVQEWSAEDEHKHHEVHRCIRRIQQLVDSKWFSGFTALLTIWALIGDDLRLMYTERPTDYIFNIITSICIFVFLVEIILGCLAKEDYFLGFFFTLDSISTVTLVMDLTFVNEAMLEGDEEDLDNIKSSRTARIGARAARIVRVLRLIRILKLWKAISEARNKSRRKRLQNMEDWDSDDEEQNEKDAVESYMRESQVGKRLSELTTRRIVVIVLTMMMIVPTLEIGKDLQLPTSLQYGADLIEVAFQQLQLDPSNSSLRTSYDKVLYQFLFYHNWFARLDGCTSEDRGCPADYWSSIFWYGIAGSDEQIVSAKAQLAQPSSLSALKFHEEALKRDTMFSFGSRLPEESYPIISGQWNVTCRSKGLVRIGVSILRNEITGAVNYAVRCPEDLRNAERSKVAPSLLTKAKFRDWHFTFYSDDRPLVKVECTCNLIMVAFICLVLAMASMMISSDANNLILRPLEGMMLKVQMIRINPLMATKLADDAFKAEEKQKSRMQSKRMKRWNSFKRLVLCQGAKVPERPMETRILENTIIKLGTLLALGFGEAGANITSRNMSADQHGVTGMVDGLPVDCIMGLASIQDFGVLTEVLQNQIMKFVNQVSEIVHGMIEEYSGAPNRNNGDSFLVIWTTAGLTPAHVAKLADMSILAFVRIFAAVHSSRVLAAYREHPLLKQRMGSMFRVNLTFGLHSGWAIEGAVGTEFKIDASYLSPNVSICESIERATNLYKVNLLVTDAVLHLCTPAMAAKCRLIDNVVVVGSPLAMQLYCIDLNSMFVDVEPVFVIPLWNSRVRFRARQVLDAEKVLKWCEDVDMLEYFSHSLEINALRMPYSKDFSYIFNMGYQNYHQGEWGAAERILANTRTMLGFEDGPSGALLQFMKDPYNFVAPKWWRGEHNLDAELGNSHAGQRDSQSRPLKAETLECEGKVFPGLRETANAKSAGDRTNRSGSPEDSPRTPDYKAAKPDLREDQIPQTVLKGQARSALKARMRASASTEGRVVERNMSRAACAEVAAEEPAMRARIVR